MCHLPRGMKTACGSAVQCGHLFEGLTVSSPKKTPTLPSKPTRHSPSSQCRSLLASRALQVLDCFWTANPPGRKPWAPVGPGGQGRAEPTYHVWGASRPQGPSFAQCQAHSNAPRRHRKPSVGRGQHAHPAFRTPWRVCTPSGCLPVGAGAQCAWRSGEHTRELVTVPPGRLRATSALASRFLRLLPGRPLRCTAAVGTGPPRTPRLCRTPAPGLPHCPGPRCSCRPAHALGCQSDPIVPPQLERPAHRLTPQPQQEAVRAASPSTGCGKAGDGGLRVPFPEPRSGRKSPRGLGREAAVEDRHLAGRGMLRTKRGAQCPKCPSSP